MATPNSVDSETDDPSNKISPWARGENLRHVEKEVLIPKIVRERAKAKCDDLVKGKQHPPSLPNPVPFSVLNISLAFVVEKGLHSKMLKH